MSAPNPITVARTSKQRLTAVPTPETSLTPDAAVDTDETRSPTPPDLVNVGINTSAVGPRIAWGLATDYGYVTAQECGEGSGHQTALFAALEHLLTNEDLAHSAINLYCPDEAMSAALMEMQASVPCPFPRLNVEEWSPARANGVLARSARRAARDLVEPISEADDTAPPAPSVRVVAATDGSAGNYKHATQVVGFGWVTETGHSGIGTWKGTRPLIGELAAILDLLQHIPAKTPLQVLCDSKDALRTVDALRAGASPLSFTFPGAAKNPRLLRWLGEALVDRDVEFMWVRGHADTALNIGADRLAVHARRAAQNAIAPEVQAMVARNIVAETMTSLTAGIQQPA